MKSRQGMITSTGTGTGTVTVTTKAASMSNEKVTSEHLARNAYLYLRQSTMKQLLENQESTRRQYALKEKAMELGWDDNRIVVIDSDKGQSGKTAQDREGFKQLVSEVSLGLAGIVIGLEVSRLSRNSADWYHLMEICGLRNTLILDEDGLYDLCNINDRLVMGFKGTISEFESHQIKNRLWGGKLFKARRGELHTPLPIGLVYSPSGQVELEPDQQVRQSLDLFFSTFRRVESGIEVVRYFNKNGLKFPRYVQGGPDKGKIEWGLLNIYRARDILKNPRYAGAFFYGKKQKKRFGDGVQVRKSVDRDQWYSLVKNSHPGYITWEEYEENLKKLRSNNFGYNPGGLKNHNHTGPVREGPALLQGLAICGICGRKMNVYYHNRKKGRIPDYICIKGHRYGEKGCQRIGGIAIDRAIGELLMASMTPLALEVAINVEKELKSRFEEADQIRRKEVERLSYEVEQACKRYMNVDPENRLVAATLEREWNDKLKQLEQARQEYELQRLNHQKVLNPQEMERVMGLASDFHPLWEHEGVSSRDRKRMVRLLIQDVALKKEKIADGAKADGYGYFTSAKVRFRGGMVKSLNIPGPKKIWQEQRTSEKIVNEIDQLLDDQTHSEIADTLNKNGHLSPTGKCFTPKIIGSIRWHYHLKSRYQRLREKGLLTLKELSDKIKIPMKAIRELEKRKMINSYKCTDKMKRLYELPGNDFIKILHSLKGKRGFPGDFIDKFSKILKEVHYEG